MLGWILGGITGWLLTECIKYLYKAIKGQARGVEGMRSMKEDKEKLFNDEVKELYEIREMLEKEGEDHGKSRYLVFVATLLLFIDESLHRICLILLCLLCFVIGKFLSGLI